MKRQYLGLDGLRGVAAFIVVAHHLERVTHTYGVFSHGYLAVDFFFILSGFVIAHAYEERLRGGTSFAAFALVRIKRLYPMIFMGSLIGLLVALGWGLDGPIGLAFVSQVFLIPGLAGGASLFLLNNVHWSLVFEIAGNLFHAATMRWLTTERLAIGVGVSAALVFLAAHRFGTLGVGWGPANWWGGIPRLAFGYGAGVLLYRLHRAGRLIELPLPFEAVALALIFALVGPGKTHGWIVDPLVTVFLMPPLVLLGAGTRPARRSGVVAWLGLVSYPLYAIHYPLAQVWAILAPHTLASAAVMAAGTAALATAIAVYYDQPVRKLLAGVAATPARVV